MEISHSFIHSAVVGGSDSKDSACNVGDLGSILGLGRCPGEGNGYSFQYSCLENLTDRGVSQAIAHGVIKSQTRLSKVSSSSWLSTTVGHCPRYWIQRLSSLSPQKIYSWGSGRLVNRLFQNSKTKPFRRKPRTLQREIGVTRKLGTGKSGASKEILLSWRIRLPK